MTKAIYGLTCFGEYECVAALTRVIRVALVVEELGDDFETGSPRAVPVTNVHDHFENLLGEACYIDRTEAILDWLTIAHEVDGIVDELDDDVAIDTRIRSIWIGIAVECDFVEDVLDELAAVDPTIVGITGVRGTSPDHLGNEIQ
jgi:hypothetical protein